MYKRVFNVLAAPARADVQEGYKIYIKLHYKVILIHQREIKIILRVFCHLGIRTRVRAWSMTDVLHFWYFLKYMVFDIKLIHLETTFYLAYTQFSNVPSRQQSSLTSLSIFMAVGSLSFNSHSKEVVNSSPFCGLLFSQLWLCVKGGSTFAIWRALPAFCKHLRHPKIISNKLSSLGYFDVGIHGFWNLNWRQIFRRLSSSIRKRSGHANNQNLKLPKEQPKRLEHVFMSLDCALSSRLIYIEPGKLDVYNILDT